MDRIRQLELLKKTIVEFTTTAFDNIIDKVKSGSVVNYTNEVVKDDIVVKVMVDNELFIFKIEYPKNKAKRKEEVLRLKATGMTQTAIAKQLGVDRKIIYNYLKDAEKDKQ